MISTLAITILVESAIVAFYATWRKKPLYHLLFSSICANLLTQVFLWAVLYLFPQAYLLTLFIAEICIWGIEAYILYLYRYNQLTLREAMLLSLVMNLASFFIGWLLPV
ncbi:MAG: hypothetical protein ABSA23_04625 [Anaerolineales bacterium]